MTRLIGAIVRAIIVVLVFAAPAFLAPGASRSAQEVSVIVGGLVAIFIFFEYVTTQPGLIDFRFADQLLLSGLHQRIIISAAAEVATGFN